MGLSSFQSTRYIFFTYIGNAKITNRNNGYSEHHAYHLYIIEVDKRKELYQFLREHNIFAQIHYIPVHLMPYYRQFGWKEGDFPKAEAYYKKCLTLPMFPTLQRLEQEQVINLIKEHID